MRARSKAKSTKRSCQKVSSGFVFWVMLLVLANKSRLTAIWPILFIYILISGQHAKVPCWPIRFLRRME